MNEKLKTEQVKRLCEAFALLRTDEECFRFLSDLCTESELQEMSKRLDAAQKLREGIIYNEIAALTGLSTATITRVNRSLRYGSDGYHMVLDRLSAKT
ncbi:MAG: YerC/YecD family TrpR-related protein [Eubacteriales bacterium]|nr:YerC/YecD family TrpR-related protein [Eubacteriales bacterium]MDD4475725.1 YerC/YecD family TrpR-related protein [Eubacteriales bacterium]